MEGFDIVVEGVTDQGDAATIHRVKELADAGATWWIESRWGDDVTAASLLDRIRQGPPSLPLSS